MISCAVPKDGLSPPRERSETAGELRTTTGSANNHFRLSITGMASDEWRHTDDPYPEDLADPEAGEF